MASILKKIKNFFHGDASNQRIKWSLYGRIWREIGKPQWKWLLLGVIATICAAGAEGYSITLVQRVVDNAFIDKNMQSTYLVGFLIIVAFGVKGAFNYARALLIAKAGLRASAALQKRIFAHMVRMDISGFYGDGVGRHLNYFYVQAAAVLRLVTNNIVSLVHQLATLIITLGLMIYYAPQVCAILIFLVPAIFVPLIIIMRRRRKLSRQSFGIANDVSQHLNQTLHGIKTIQSFGTETVETRKFGQVLENSMINSYKTTQAVSLQSPLLELMISIGLCFALILGGHFIVTGVITTGDFTAFLLALIAAYRPAKGITGTGDTIQHGLLASEVLFDFLDTKPSIRDIRDAKELRAVQPSVEFKNVDFSYVDGEPVLKDINLHVAPGQVCALVGPSGGGKTTMFNLIERFYDPTGGFVAINGTNIQKYTLESLRKNIADVSQDVFLFNDTVAANIKYGAPNASHDAVVAAARAANADEFIRDLPDGYDTCVGEGGALLSGGQKQRVAIARAILKDAPILLLDEATSALDTESEKLIQSALRDLMRGRTTFVIAHRLSTILDADIICVIKDGRIIEQGTDSELIAMDGEYKKLRDIQFENKK